jgi:putative lipoic acid-binding regulatory protein
MRIKESTVTALQSIELLESTHRFPGRYMFKVIGKNEKAFVARAVAAIRDALDAAKDPPFRVRETAGGRHVSVTVEPWVENATQVLAVYRRIQKLSGLVMLW